jgi:5,10-methylenetetrahydrofolate reductase
VHLIRRRAAKFSPAMKIAYELNPPKLTREGHFDPQRLDSDIEALKQRALQLDRYVDSIHLTDSVLGRARVSSITAASLVKKLTKRVKLSCSIRTSDRNIITLCQAAADAIISEVDSLLILRGDIPTDGRSSGLKPSDAVRMLREQAFDCKLNLDLSFPAKIIDKNAQVVKTKLAAQPNALVTQSVSSISDLSEIVDLARLHGISVVACIMVPSEKNEQSARMIGLDWSGYEKEPVEFVKEAGQVAGSVLITSPNSFQSGLDLLKSL